MARLTRDIFQKFDHGDCVLSDYVEDIDSLRRLTKQASAVVVILSEGALCDSTVAVIVVIACSCADFIPTGTSAVANLFSGSL
eukprot:5800014-Amphidinium_carterae.1